MAVAAVQARLAIKLMANDPNIDQYQKRIDGYWSKLRATLSPEEIRPIEYAARVFTSLAEKLVACENMVALESAVGYADALLQGDVLIAVENGYESNK